MKESNVKKWNEVLKEVDFKKVDLRKIIAEGMLYFIKSFSELKSSYEEDLSISSGERKLFSNIESDIKNQPQKYYSAGKWLDGFHDEEIFFLNRARELKKLFKYRQANWLADAKNEEEQAAIILSKILFFLPKKAFGNVLDLDDFTKDKYIDKALALLDIKPFMENQNNKKLSENAKLAMEKLEWCYQEYKSKNMGLNIKLFFLADAVKKLLKDRTLYNFVDLESAKRTCLITWIMTDPDAESCNLKITKFENWPWKSCIRASAFSVAVGLSEYKKWIELANISWERIKLEKEKCEKSGSLKRSELSSKDISGINEPSAISNKKSKTRHKKIYVLITGILGFVLLLTSLMLNFKDIREWLFPQNNDSISAPVNEDISGDNLIVSLKRICDDIDSRPLAQRGETAKRYIGINVQQEQLKLININKVPKENIYYLTMVFPEQSEISYTSRRILLDIPIEKCPELELAEEGLIFHVSGEIVEAGARYITLSNVSLKFD